MVPGNDSLLGVPVESGIDSMPIGYEEALNKRMKNGDPSVRSVYDTFKDKVKIKELDYDGRCYASNMEEGKIYGSHYNPTLEKGGTLQGIYMSAEEDMYRSTGAGTIYFHEIAHAIDNLLGGPNGCFSCRQDFYDALLADARAFETKYDNDEVNIDYLYTPAFYSVCDLMNGITHGRISGGYVHDQNYNWNMETTCTEAFAHFCETSMANDYHSTIEPCNSLENRFDVMVNIFPNAYGVFRNIISDIERSSQITDMDDIIR